jgi:hypothetical protein
MKFSIMNCSIHSTALSCFSFVHGYNFVFVTVMGVGIDQSVWRLGKGLND